MANRVGVASLFGPMDGPSLSALEKYLLRHGWELEDNCDPATGLVATTASRPGTGESLTYPKPAYLRPERDRAVDLAMAMEAVARIEGVPTARLARDMAETLARTPDGFACRQCGQCCGRMRDAFQGRVSLEEVEYWQGLGLTRILRLVQARQTPNGAVFRAWVNPRTGRYLDRCPWLRKGPDGQARLCAIHAHRPLKCRSFPLSRDHAEYSGCRGFEPLAPAPKAPAGHPRAA
jgi:Fe-S-cluster containining protein